MTKQEIKEMLSGIINDGEKWECRPNGSGLAFPSKYYKWKLYELGDEIRDHWEYRKVEEHSKNWPNENYPLIEDFNGKGLNQNRHKQQAISIFDAVIDKNGELQILPAAWVQQKINNLTQTWKSAHISEHGVIQDCIVSDVENMNKEIINKIKYNDEYRDDIVKNFFKNFVKEGYTDD